MTQRNEETSKSPEPATPHLPVTPAAKERSAKAEREEEELTPAARAKRDQKIVEEAYVESQLKKGRDKTQTP